MEFQLFLQILKTMMKQNSIKTNGINISYLDSANDKEPLIFIHGFPFNKSSWQPQLESLQSEARVIAYDLRGFGQSEPGNEKASIQLYADDLIKLMDALDLKKAIVCGLSMGGYILLNAVDRYPERFKAIILSDTQCLADSDEGKEKRYATIKEIDEKGLEPFTEKFLKAAFSKHASPETVQKIKQVILSNSPKTIQAALAALAERKESCSHLKNIHIQTLILCGEEDELTTLPQSEFLFNNIPGAKMHAIEKAGHLSNLEQPEIFNKHLKDFITGF